MVPYYFMIIDGRQSGPYHRDTLRAQGLTKETFVWRDGLADWVQAGTLAELDDLFNEDSAFGGYARPEEPLPPHLSNGSNSYGQQSVNRPNPYNTNPYRSNNYGQPSYGNPDPYSRQPIAHTNWMPWAIIGTVVGALFCCLGLIFGIIGITKAGNANKFYNAGNKELGDLANSSARTMSIIALVLGGIGFIMVITGQTAALRYRVIEFMN